MEEEEKMEQRKQEIESLKASSWLLIWTGFPAFYKASERHINIKIPLRKPIASATFDMTF